MLYSVALAFSNIRDLKTFKLSFAGLDNFRQALVNDMEFMPSLAEALKNLVDVPIILVFSLFVAILLNRRFKGRSFFRLVFMMTLVLGASVVMQVLEGNQASVTMSMGMTAAGAGKVVSNSLGALKLNHQLQMFFGPALSDVVGSIVGRLQHVMWISGIQIIIFLGALQGIPRSLYEAADIDSATAFDKFWMITLPLSMPAVELNLVFSVIDSFTSIDNSVMKYVTEISFSNLQLSYGSAIAWMYFVIVALILGIAFIIIRRISRKYE